MPHCWKSHVTSHINTKYADRPGQTVYTKTSLHMRKKSHFKVKFDLFQGQTIIINVIKKVILWKQRIYQRTESVERIGLDKHKF